MTTKIKQIYNNIKICNHVQENLRQSRDIFFKLCKRKNEEKSNRNIRSSSERLSITNAPLLPILTQLETEKTTETNDATEEQTKTDFQEELQSHTRGAWSLPNLQKQKKQKTTKILKTKKKEKLWVSFAEVSNSHQPPYLTKWSWKTMYNSSHVSYVCLYFSTRKISR